MNDEDFHILETHKKNDIESKFNDDMTPSIVSGRSHYDLLRKRSKRKIHRR
jgi:hypothetical protein